MLAQQTKPLEALYKKISNKNVAGVKADLENLDEKAINEVDQTNSRTLLSFAIDTYNHGPQLVDESVEIITLLLARNADHQAPEVIAALKKLSKEKDWKKLHFLFEPLKRAKNPGDAENVIGRYYEAVYPKSTAIRRFWYQLATIKQQKHYRDPNYVCTKSSHGIWNFALVLDNNSSGKLYWLERAYQYYDYHKATEDCKQTLEYFTTLSKDSNQDDLFRYAAQMAIYRLQPGSKTTPLETAMIHLQQDRIEEATQEFAALTKIDPGMKKAIGTLQSALDSKEVKNVSPAVKTPIHIQFLQSLFEQAQQGSAEAKKWLFAMYTGVGSLGARIWASSLLVKVTNIPTQRVKDSQERLATYPDFNKGLEALYGPQGDPSQAIVCFEKCITDPLYKEHVDIRLIAYIQLNLAASYCKAALISDNKAQHVQSALAIYQQLLPTYHEFENFTRREIIDQLILIARIGTEEQKKLSLVLLIEIYKKELKLEQNSLSNIIVRELHQANLLAGTDYPASIFEIIKRNLRNRKIINNLIQQLKILAEITFPFKDKAREIIDQYEQENQIKKAFKEINISDTSVWIPASVSSDKPKIIINAFIEKLKEEKNTSFTLTHLKRYVFVLMLDNKTTPEQIQECIEALLDSPCNKPEFIEIRNQLIFNIDKYETAAENFLPRIYAYAKDNKNNLPLEAICYLCAKILLLAKNQDSEMTKFAKDFIGKLTSNRDKQTHLIGLWFEKISSEQARDPNPDIHIALALANDTTLEPDVRTRIQNGIYKALNTDEAHYRAKMQILVADKKEKPSHTQSSTDTDQSAASTTNNPDSVPTTLYPTLSNTDEKKQAAPEPTREHKNTDLFQKIKNYGNHDHFAEIKKCIEEMSLNSINEIRSTGLFSTETLLSVAILRYIELPPSSKILRGDLLEIIFLLILHNANHEHTSVKAAIGKLSDKNDTLKLREFFKKSLNYYRKNPGQIECGYAAHYGVYLNNHERAALWSGEGVKKQLYSSARHINLRLSLLNYSAALLKTNQHFESIKWAEKGITTNFDANYTFTRDVTKPHLALAFKMAKARISPGENKELTDMDKGFIALQMGNMNLAKKLLSDLDSKSVDQGMVVAINIIKSAIETKDIPKDINSPTLQPPAHLRMLFALENGATQKSNIALDYLVMYTATGSIAMQIFASSLLTHCFAKAIPSELFAECSQRIKNYEQFHHGLRALYNDPADLDKAKSAFEFILKENPQDIEVFYLDHVRLKLAAVHCKQAMIAQKEENIDQALAIHQSFLSQYPKWDCLTRLELVDQLFYLNKIASPQQRIKIQNQLIALLEMEQEIDKDNLSHYIAEKLSATIDLLIPAAHTFLAKYYDKSNTQLSLDHLKRAAEAGDISSALDIAKTAIFEDRVKCTWYNVALTHALDSKVADNLLQVIENNTFTQEQHPSIAEMYLKLCRTVAMDSAYAQDRARIFEAVIKCLSTLIKSDNTSYEKIHGIIQILLPYGDAEFLNCAENYYMRQQPPKIDLAQTVKGLREKQRADNDHLELQFIQDKSAKSVQIKIPKDCKQNSPVEVVNAFIRLFEANIQSPHNLKIISNYFSIYLKSVIDNPDLNETVFSDCLSALYSFDSSRPETIALQKNLLHAVQLHIETTRKGGDSQKLSACLFHALKNRLLHKNPNLKLTRDDEFIETYKKIVDLIESSISSASPGQKAKYLEFLEKASSSTLPPDLLNRVHELYFKHVKSNTNKLVILSRNDYLPAVFEHAKLGKAKIHYCAKILLLIKDKNAAAIRFKLSLQQINEMREFAEKFFASISYEDTFSHYKLRLYRHIIDSTTTLKYSTELYIYLGIYHPDKINLPPNSIPTEWHQRFNYHEDWLAQIAKEAEAHGLTISSLRAPESKGQEKPPRYESSEGIADTATPSAPDPDAPRPAVVSAPALEGTPPATPRVSVKVEPPQPQPPSDIKGNPPAVEGAPAATPRVSVKVEPPQPPSDFKDNPPAYAPLQPESPEEEEETINFAYFQRGSQPVKAAPVATPEPHKENEVAPAPAPAPHREVEVVAPAPAPAPQEVKAVAPASPSARQTASSTARVRRAVSYDSALVIPTPTVVVSEKTPNADPAVASEPDDAKASSQVVAAQQNESDVDNEIDALKLPEESDKEEVILFKPKQRTKDQLFQPVLSQTPPDDFGATMGKEIQSGR